MNFDLVDEDMEIYVSPLKKQRFDKIRICMEGIG